jgi:hypothetical protein
MDFTSMILYLTLQTDMNYVIMSGSIVFVRTLAASHRRLYKLSKTIGRTPLDE